MSTHSDLIDETLQKNNGYRVDSSDFLCLSDGKNCKTCDRILSILETKTVELEDAGIKTVRINDKKTAKSVFQTLHS